MDTLLLNAYLIPFISGLVIGLITAFVFTKLFLNKPKATKSPSHEKNKLEKEVLNDQVKQLEAKIKTLEKALEMSQKL